MIGVPVEDSHLPSGMLHAMAYNRPLLLAQKDAMLYQNQIAPTRVFSDTSMSRSLERLIEFLEPRFFHRKPDCQVLIDNHQFDFHYFLLESFMALYPLPETPECNHNYLQFTFLIHRSGNPFQRNRAESWKRYALGDMSQKYRSDRIVKTVIWGTETSSIPSGDYHYIIKASCYCIEEDVAWLSGFQQYILCIPRSLRRLCKLCQGFMAEPSSQTVCITNTTASLRTSEADE
jgi:hypothetical protein